MTHHGAGALRPTPHGPPPAAYGTAAVAYPIVPAPPPPRRPRRAIALLLAAGCLLALLALALHRPAPGAAVHAWLVPPPAPAWAALRTAPPRPPAGRTGHTTRRQSQGGIAIVDPDFEPEPPAEAEGDMASLPIAVPDALPEDVRMKFDNFPISGKLSLALTRNLKLKYATEVQRLSIMASLEDCDVVAQAPPGSGRTLIGVVPVIEKMIRAPKWRSRDRFGALILTSSRERAHRIQDVCNTLAQFTDIRVRLIASGGEMQKDMEQLRQTVDVLIATPGRLLEFISLKWVVREKLQGVHTLVVDDADVLSALGLWPDVEGLMHHLPSPRWRSTVIVGANLPNEIVESASRMCRADATLVVKLSQDVPLPPSWIVPSLAVVTSLTEQIATLHCLLRTATQQPGHRILVYFPTTRLCQAYSHVFRSMNIDLLESHSRVRPDLRDMMLEAFRVRTNTVLFTTETPVYGMNYANVSLVVQVGVTSSNEQYMLRLGRPTLEHRPDIQRSVVLIAEFEADYLDFIAPLKARRVAPPPLEEEDWEFQNRSLQTFKELVVTPFPRDLYISLIAYYRSLERVHHRTATQVVAIFNAYIRWFFSINHTPRISPRTAWLLGMLDTPGLALAEVLRTTDRGRKPKPRGIGKKKKRGGR